MKDPYKTIGVSADVDDAALRQRYLELVRLHPPEKAPQRFAEIREAYDLLRDPVVRVRRRVLEPSQDESIEDVIGDLQARVLAARFPTETLLSLAEV